MTQIFATCCPFGSRGRVVKATDLKSVGVSPRRFKSCRLRLAFLFLVFIQHYFSSERQETQIFATCCPFGSRGRVVKATDLKSVGVSPRRFKSCRLRLTILRLLLVQNHLVLKDKWRKYLLFVVYSVVVAEWLRLYTRNLLGYSRAGSNPADYDWHLFSLFLFKIILVQKDKWRKSLLLVVHSVVVAEWLRRQTWNLLGSPRARSNPADYHW